MKINYTTCNCGLKRNTLLAEVCPVCRLENIRREYQKIDKNYKLAKLPQGQRLYDRTCPECQKEFKTKYKTGTYCNMTCSAKARERIKKLNKK